MACVEKAKQLGAIWVIFSIVDEMTYNLATSEVIWLDCL